MLAALQYLLYFYGAITSLYALYFSKKGSKVMQANLNYQKSFVWLQLVW